LCSDTSAKTQSENVLQNSCIFHKSTSDSRLVLPLPLNLQSYVGMIIVIISKAIPVLH